MDDMKAFTGLVATALGDDWTASNGTWSDGQDAYLDGPDGARVHLLPGRNVAQSGRLVLIGYWDTAESRERAYDARPHSITVAPTTSPERVARELSRRLLPAYLAERLEVLGTMESRERWEEARQATIAELLVSSGGTRLGESYREDIRVGEIERGGKIRVQNSELVEFDVELPKPLALLVARVIRDGLAGK
jgi:hypothetical protein